MGKLQEIPGVGKNIEQDLINIGIREISDLKGKKPEELYLQDCLYKGFQEDKCALSQNSDRAHYPRYSTIRGNFQIVAIYKDFKEISSDNVTTILESPATDSPFSVLQNFPFAGRTISRSNPGYACSQSPVKAQRTVRS